ncbi:O-antigen ligase family protein, partial [Paraclostridium bifermentans]|uniref:O-antigen ligase family protein n=1 Tax=Paraclostridium bifermentans TaxID=1490 RepID=UPI0022E0507A
ISPKFLNYKNIHGIILPKHIFINSNIMEFSTTAILSLYLVFLALNIKNNRKLKTSILIVNILLILYLGKLSVILTGVASILIVGLIRFISKTLPNKKTYVILSIIMVATVALTGILLPHIIKSPNLIKLFSGRLELWERFTSYFTEGGLKALFGYGFVDPNLNIGKFYHPHNQYITVLYTTGLFGYLAYISILIYTLNKNIIFSIKHKIYSNLYILISILILQVADDYFVLTSFPLTICIIIYYLNNNPEQKNRKMVAI